MSPLHFDFTVLKEFGLFNNQRDKYRCVYFVWCVDLKIVC